MFCSITTGIALVGHLTGNLSANLKQDVATTKARVSRCQLTCITYLSIEPRKCRYALTIGANHLEVSIEEQNPYPQYAVTDGI